MTSFAGAPRKDISTPAARTGWSNDAGIGLSSARSSGPCTSHAAVREAAVVAVPDADAGVRIVAFLACHAGKPPSIVELKTFCGTKVPAYMSPDRFLFEDVLPHTSTDKVDYQALRGRSYRRRWPLTLLLRRGSTRPSAG